MNNIPRILAMMLIILPLSALSAQSGGVAKTFTGEVMDSICASNGSHAAMIAKIPNMGRDSETCTKKCVAMGAKYVLYEQTSRTVYPVDDQNKLAAFAGHKVRVTGTQAGSTIKVASIDELS
jgi:hypothetical protein